MTFLDKESLTKYLSCFFHDLKLEIQYILYKVCIAEKEYRYFKIFENKLVVRVKKLS